MAPEDREPGNDHRGEGEPSDRIDEMGVSEGHDRQACDGIAAIAHPGRIDEIGGDGALDAFGLRNPRDIAGIPSARCRVVVPQESAAGLAHAQKTGDAGRARLFDTRCRIEIARGNEAAIDEDGEAALRSKRGHQPIAAAEIGGGEGECGLGR